MSKIKQTATRLLAGILAFGMMIALVPAMTTPVLAANNGYGHAITYTPVGLYADGKPVSLFDEKMTAFSPIANNSGGNQRYWLANENYSLNRFGALVEKSSNAVAPNPFNGYISNSNSSLFTAKYDFSAFASPSNGNIYNMIQKGDISLALASKVYIHQHDKTVIGFFVTKKVDLSSIAEFAMLQEFKRVIGSGGNRWENFNYTSDGKINLSGLSSWKPLTSQGLANNMLNLSFMGSAYNSGPVSTTMDGGILLGKDSKGPKLASVSFSWDMNNWKTIDTIKNMDVGRTAYVRVTFDEPVKFKSGFDSEANLKDLKLTIQTLGKDGSTAMPADAHFLKYAPSQNDSSPSMYFEYKIQNPSDPLARKDKYYTFSSVKITSSENSYFYNNLTDIAGNAFGAENGQPPVNYTKQVSSGVSKFDQATWQWVQSSPTVDLEPLVIESVNITRSGNVKDIYLTLGTTVDVTLNLNKVLVFNNSDVSQNLPAITLNVNKSTDGGEFMPITLGNQPYSENFYYATTKANANGPDRTSITYRVKLVPNEYVNGKWVRYQYSGGDPISLAEVSIAGKTVKDSSGYTLDVSNIPTFTGTPYRVDTTAPEINVTITSEQTDIVKIYTQATDISLAGRAAAVAVSTDLDSENPLLYQISTTEGYGSQWETVAVGKGFIENIPLAPPGEETEKGAYIYVKLPDNAQMTQLTVKVSITDAAGNTGTKSATFDQAFDTRVPVVSLQQLSVSKGITAELKAQDMSTLSYEYAWSVGLDQPQPGVWETGGSFSGNGLEKTSTIICPDDMSANDLFLRTLWVKVTDSFGNESVASLNCRFDNVHGEVIINSLTPNDPNLIILSGDALPEVDITLINIREYYYTWMEWRPELSSDSWYDLSVLGQGRRIPVADDDLIPGDVYTNTTNIIATLTPDTDVHIYGPTSNYAYDPDKPHYISWGYEQGKTKKASELSGPVVLAIFTDSGVNHYLKDQVYKYIQFNTFMKEGGAEVQHVRFSSNDYEGRRSDSMRTHFGYGYDSYVGLYYPEDITNRVIHSASDVIMLPELYDFGEAEFVLRGNNYFGLAMLDLKGGTKVTLQRITFTDGDDVSNSGYFGYDTDANGEQIFDYNNDGIEDVISRETIQSWNITEDMLNRLSYGPYSAEIDHNSDKYIDYLGDYSFTLSLDLDKINPIAYDADGNLYRYEFWIHTAYKDELQVSNTDKRLSMFIFQNENPSVSFEGIVIEREGYYTTLASLPHGAVQASLSGTGSNIVDNSNAIPKIMFSGNNRVGDVLAQFKIPIPTTAETMLNFSTAVGEVYPEGRTYTHTFAMRAGTLESLREVNGTIEIDSKAPHYYQSTAAHFYDGIAEVRMSLESESAENSVYYAYFPKDGDLVSLYYQYVNQPIMSDGPPIGAVSPVYRVDILRDDTPPEIKLAVSQNEMTNGDVIVGIESVKDGRVRNDGLGDYFAVDTPTEEIVVTIEAKYADDDSEVLPVDGSFIFTRNGTFTVTAVDLAGNIGIAVHTVNNIDREPPVITGTANIETGKALITANVASDDATTAYISFDTAYANHLSAGADENTRFTLDSVPGGIRGLFDQAAQTITLELHVKPGVQMQSAKLIVTDKAGNAGELPFVMHIDGVAPTITNVNKIYVYGEPLTFSTLAKLTGITSDQTGYATSYVNLPIFADGPVAISYEDLFANSYTEEITAEIHGVAYRHSITISPDTPTNQNVTVTVNGSGYPVSVQGGVNGILSQTLTDNGNVTYTIIPDDLYLSAKTFTVPVTNIDKTAPTASYIRTVNGTETFDGSNRTAVNGSVTYTILGFNDENDVTMDEDEPLNYTFIDAGVHTFRFTDAAGNKGTLVANESDTAFNVPPDMTIAKYRLTYGASGANPVKLGMYEQGGAELILAPTNKSISVLVEALNAAGDVIPSAMATSEATANVQYYLSQNTLVFTENAATTVTLSTSFNSITVPIAIIVIDKIAPIGMVDYEQLTEDDPPFVKGGIKGYLVTYESDIESVTGNGVQQEADGRYFIYFDENGQGTFYLTDTAGNVGTVIAIAFGIDFKGPQPEQENWYSAIAAKPGAPSGTSGNSKEDVLGTLTNNSIRVFFVFDELLRNVEVTVYSDDKTTVIPDATPYIGYTHSGNTLTLEFKQNCQAKIVAYDVRGNATTLWRPEDGPITVIDKNAPTVTNTLVQVLDNKVHLTYTFSEEVVSANEKTDFAITHTVVIDKNGIYPLTYADAVGNVVTIAAEINQIDDLSPKIYYTLGITPQSAGITYLDAPTNERIAATNGNVEIAFRAEDPNGATVTVINRNKPSVAMTNFLPINNYGVAYDNAVIATDNGIYEITAVDDFGNTNVVYIKIDFIDKTAPVISLEDSKAVEVTINSTISEDELKAALLTGVTAKDDREGAVKVTVDVSVVNMAQVGSYVVTYLAEDSLGNTAKRSRTVAVLSGARKTLKIDGKSIRSNDIYTTHGGKVTVVDPDSGYRLYAAQGFKTRAQMKYADKLAGDLEALEPGYYTILAQGAERDGHLFYVYIH